MSISNEPRAPFPVKKENNNRKRSGKDSKKPPTHNFQGWPFRRAVAAHRKRFFCRMPILGEALHGLKGVDIYERFHLTHIPTVFFLFELRVRMMRARQSRKSFAGVCAYEAVQKGALFFLFSRSPRRRPLVHYLYIVTLGYSTVLLFGQFFFF